MDQLITRTYVRYAVNAAWRGSDVEIPRPNPPIGASGGKSHAGVPDISIRSAHPFESDLTMDSRNLVDRQPNRFDGKLVVSTDRPGRIIAARPGAILCLLGGFELLLDGEAMVLPSTARRVLAFLALRGRRVARPFVSQSLWMDATEEHADGNLRSAVWRVSQVSAAILDTSGGGLSLTRHVHVDFHVAQRLARQLLDSPDTLLEAELKEELLLEDLLPDWYEEWVLAERERHRQLRLHGLENLCLRLISLKRPAQAIQAGLAAVSAEPLRESANVVLIRAFLAEGNRSEALRHFQSFERVLRAELGVSPSDATMREVRRLL
jgi:DNA-binding SARP family transcriptional activator